MAAVIEGTLGPAERVGGSSLNSGRPGSLSVLATGLLGVLFGMTPSVPKKVSCAKATKATTRTATTCKVISIRRWRATLLA